MSIISALIGVDLGRRLKKLGEKWGGGLDSGESAGRGFTPELRARRAQE